MAALYIALETWLLLKRHRIILPIVLVFAAVCFLASFGSGLVQDEFRKMLFDTGLFGFHLAGGVVAIFWGAKSLSDSQQEGSLEVQLASPVGRVTWLIGKYLGLALALAMLVVIFCGLWQAAMLLLDMGWMTSHELLTIAAMSVVWFILAALVILFASFCSLPVATFGCLTLWALGMSATYFSTGIPEDASYGTKAIGAALGRYWNLRQLNLGDYLYRSDFPVAGELLWRFSYGGALVVVILVAACGVFSRRDLVR